VKGRVRQHDDVRSARLLQRIRINIWSVEYPGNCREFTTSYSGSCAWGDPWKGLLSASLTPNE
jgi:hypothetical protein